MNDIPNSASGVKFKLCRHLPLIQIGIFNISYFYLFSFYIQSKIIFFNLDSRFRPRLKISAANISSIEDNAFTGLSLLEDLELVENFLISITTQTFNGLTGLTLLNLYYNEIETIEDNAFAGLTKLTSLVLDI